MNGNAWYSIALPVFHNVVNPNICRFSSSLPTQSQNHIPIRPIVTMPANNHAHAHGPPPAYSVIDVVPMLTEDTASSSRSSTSEYQHDSGSARTSDSLQTIQASPAMYESIHIPQVYLPTTTRAVYDASFRRQLATPVLPHLQTRYRERYQHVGIFPSQRPGYVQPHHVTSMPFKDRDATKTATLLCCGVLMVVLIIIIFTIPAALIKSKEPHEPRAHNTSCSIFSTGSCV